jgi:hypothetical protein
MISTTLALLSLAGALETGPALPPVSALAVEEAPPVPRTAVRANGIIQGFDFAGLGVEVSHSFDDRFAFEASLDTLDLNRGLTGVYGQALARVGYFGPGHSVSFGLGAGILDGSAFGAVAFALPELAYEYRPLRGVSVAVGLGVPVTLNDSAEVPCESNAFLGCFLETTQFHQGDLSIRARLALGYSF